MRRSLSSFVAMFCLLTLFVSSAACIAVALPQDALVTWAQHGHSANAQDHGCCPKNSPASEHSSTTCCTVHHQPVSAASVVELEHPIVFSHAALPGQMMVAATVFSTASRSIGPPQQPPLIALRI